MPTQAFLTARVTAADDVALLTAVKAALANDPTLGLSYTGDPARFVATKATAWQPAEIAAVQTALDTTVARDDAAIDVDVKVLRAVSQALWECIPAPTKTLVQLRARALAIWRTL